MSLAGADLVLLPEGVLWWPAEATLVVADLHLEKGSSGARRGALLPPYDTAATLAALAGVVVRFAPGRIVSLGDAFHDPFALERLQPADRARIEALQAGREWIWIAGNHDARLVGCIGGRTVAELAIGPLVFRHEPSPDGPEGEVAGHLHPAARVALRPKSVRRRCFATDGRRLVLPAFGAYAGGLNLLDRAYRGLFERTSLVAHLLGEGRVYPFPSRFLLAD
ncbi:ligase-associated DNA damage response endonuclease PdeM [Prosthecomicrobium sp. N25]|uniref:ligase-associated DNA damage response endonuclease PdeM n=1 Tax=Prosthecomicrobium sp. N25 TaxID=3129254 RepID=UPI003078192C